MENREKRNELLQDEENELDKMSWLHGQAKVVKHVETECKQLEMDVNEIDKMGWLHGQAGHVANGHTLDKISASNG